MRGLNMPPSPQTVFAKYGVNVPGKVEVIWNPLYDYQATVAAATSSQRFFIDPIGANGKTLADTNMELAGQIPKGQLFLITGIQVDFTPDLDIAQQSEENQYANDIDAFYNGGALRLSIGSKSYVEQAPLIKFPPVNRLTVESSTSVTTAAQNYCYSAAIGREYAVRDLALISNQNFYVDILEREAVSTTGRVGITLNGWLYRNAQ